MDFKGFAALLLALLPAAVAQSVAEPIAGLWEATIQINGVATPFPLEISGSGANVTASFFNGDDRYTSTQGRFENGKLVLDWDYYATTLEAAVKDGVLEGRYAGTRRMKGPFAIRARRVTALNIPQDANTKLTAYRPAAARLKGLPEPTDPDLHTTMKDPTEPFQFSFPDLNGHVVSDADARFRGKVLVVEITGSWCPNCHDEAPFLTEMYRRYGGQGLEIVSLSFEEAEQLQNPTRLRAFVKKYGLEFSVLLCGEPEGANAKLPQLVNWNTWPATLFMDRQHVVRGIHSGFPSSGSGDLFRQAEGEFNVEVGRLLAEK